MPPDRAEPGASNCGSAMIAKTSGASRNRQIRALGTTLHDRFMLPDFYGRISGRALDLRQVGYDFAGLVTRQLDFRFFFFFFFPPPPGFGRSILAVWSRWEVRFRRRSNLDVW